METAPEPVLKMSPEQILDNTLESPDDELRRLEHDSFIVSDADSSFRTLNDSLLASSTLSDTTSMILFLFLTLSCYMNVW